MPPSLVHPSGSLGCNAVLLDENGQHLSAARLPSCACPLAPDTELMPHFEGFLVTLDGSCGPEEIPGRSMNARASGVHAAAENIAADQPPRRPGSLPLQPRSLTSNVSSCRTPVRHLFAGLPAHKGFPLVKSSPRKLQPRLGSGSSSCVPAPCAPQQPSMEASPLHYLPQQDHASHHANPPGISHQQATGGLGYAAPSGHCDRK